MTPVRTVFLHISERIIRDRRCSLCTLQARDFFPWRIKYLLQTKLPVVSEMCRFASESKQQVKYPEEEVDENVEGLISKPYAERSLEQCNEDLETYAPYIKPSFNFAAYVNKSPTLQELVKLGVDLHKVEKKRNTPEYLLQLDFERDMSKHIRFLHDVGVAADSLGKFITKNPYIFRENIDDLSTRVNYLQYKKFTKNGIARIVTANPFWLMFSTEKIDWRLGFFQKTFTLTGPQIRFLAQKQPKLITYKVQKIKDNTFAIKEEMGFSDEEMKKMLLQTPRLWIISQKSLLPRFNFVHNVMKIHHEQIVTFSNVLTCRELRIKQRHLFLVALNRAQYDCKLDGYVSLAKLISGTDTEFCDNVAKSSVQTFNEFLKTLC